jgi:hypothetical protein
MILNGADAAILTLILRCLLTTNFSTSNTAYTGMKQWLSQTAHEIRRYIQKATSDELLGEKGKAERCYFYKKNAHA